MLLFSICFSRYICICKCKLWVSRTGAIAAASCIPADLRAAKLWQGICSRQGESWKAHFDLRMSTFFPASFYDVSARRQKSREDREQE